ncbi:MAG: 4-phosphoerythronate dehydrogenase [Muribaculaceae bacterium]|nr:4-phosphoerythronate dehydrogenase [Muribaculaceae bacterium]
MRIIIDDKIPFIRQRLEPVAEVVYADPSKITKELVKDADALIVRTRTLCGAELLKDSGVKLVATATIGTDHIDSEWCRANGITVCNAAGCNAPGVAQYVWAALLRNGFDISSHTLGVIGKGHIGTIVADWGRKAGARVIVCDPPRKRARYDDEDYLPLETLLKEADAVTLHTPLTKGGIDNTFHLIGEKELQLIKPGSILINASRGPVVDNSAWAEATQRKVIRSIVDVWEGEPSIDSRLLENAIVATPHIAGYSREGKERATRMALEAVEKEFGVNIDKSGLEGDYKVPSTVGKLEKVVDSYDPAIDTEALRNDPLSFERLRSEYQYRMEPRF